MKILIVCGAGASSTFVAQRINRAARDRSVPHVAAAASEAMLHTELAGVDLVLVGPHLASQFTRIEALAATQGAAAFLLDPDVFSDIHGTRTLDLIDRLAGDHRI